MHGADALRAKNNNIKAARRGGLSDLLQVIVKNLVEFWRELDVDSGPLYVHPEDKEWISTHWKQKTEEAETPLQQEPIQDWKSYLQSDRFGSRESQPHFSLIPVPYVGNLQRAKIIICLANPGLADADYYAESQLPFKLALQKNLKQDADLRYPFVYLNPEFAWSPAFHWWVRRLKPIIQQLKDDGLSYVETLELLSNNIAVIELFPYHSRDVAEIQGWSTTNLLPSVKVMHRYFADLTSHSDKLTVLMRSHRLWQHSGGGAESGSCIHGNKGQALSFALDTPVGKAMIEILCKAHGITTKA